MQWISTVNWPGYNTFEIFYMLTWHTTFVFTLAVNAIGTWWHDTTLHYTPKKRTNQPSHFFSAIRKTADSWLHDKMICPKLEGSPVKLNWDLVPISVYKCKQIYGKRKRNSLTCTTRSIVLHVGSSSLGRLPHSLHWGTPSPTKKKKWHQDIKFQIMKPTFLGHTEF